MRKVAGYQFDKRRIAFLTLLAFIVIVIIVSIAILNNPRQCPPTFSGEPSIHAGLADPNFDTDGDCIANGQDPDANGDGIKDDF
jgi:hypothetical protein